MIEDTKLPVIVIVNDGEDFMGLCFDTADDLAEEAKIISQLNGMDNEEFKGTSDAIRRVCTNLKYFAVSKDKWTPEQPQSIGALFGLLGLKAMLTVAKQQGWPLHGHEPNGDDFWEVKPEETRVHLLHHPQNWSQGDTWQR